MGEGDPTPFGPGSSGPAAAAGSASRPAAPASGRRGGLLRIIGPGLLVAATGVGAGDLATAALVGSELGVVVAWAVLLGALWKFVLTEGLARWQLATGTTFLEGVRHRLGPVARFILLLYLLPWSFFVGAALMGACGVAAHALVPVFDDAATAKVAFGAAHSLAGLALVRWGGFRLFERVMGACVVLMVGTVVLTAIVLLPDAAALGAGLIVPRVPSGGGALTIALIGGVGGTMTILGYGYWIRAEGRHGLEDLPTCRVDLGAGYAMTALFGVAMLVIGSTVAVEGGGATLIVQLGERLGEALGPAARAAFLVGAWAAVFSSLLGVWQVVPFLFADILREGDASPEALERTRAYRLYQIGLAVVPVLGLAIAFRRIQVAYAVVGATFLPLLAVALLVLNGRRAWVGASRNGPVTIALLVAALLFFAWMGWSEIAG